MPQFDLFGKKVLGSTYVFPIDRATPPGCDVAREMTIASGTNLWGVDNCSGDIGLLEEVCLKSHIWSSKTVLLTWKTKYTKQGNIIFQLAASKSSTNCSGELQTLTPVMGDSKHIFHSQMWPTPTANGEKLASIPTPGMARHYEKKKANILEAVVYTMFPTPTNSMVTMGDFEQARYAGNSGNRPKYQDVKMFPTPKSRDWKGQTQRGIHAPLDALPNMDKGDGTPIGGTLNPNFVEWLMGFPKDWTELMGVER